jgi:glucose-6-phosphate isomerase
MSTLTITCTAEDAGLDVSVIRERAARVAGYTKHLQAVLAERDWQADEASILLADESIASVQAMLDRKKTASLKYVVVIGIGGSNLGAYAVYQALRGSEDAFLNGSLPKMIFADTVSSKLLVTLTKIFEQQVQSPDEILITLISKSGTTTETIANADIILQPLLKRFGEGFTERIVAITDQGSKLHALAQSHHIDTLFVPAKVGGRYSVFSPIGLFPLGVAGVNINALAAGAREIRDAFLRSDDVLENKALVSASIQSLRREQGQLIHNSFFFNPELEMVGKWYRQLTGESLGKTENRSGEKLYAGITPMVSIGSTDLHSMVQLYFGGPRDKFTSFVFSPSTESPKVSADGLVASLVPGIRGKSADDILQAIYEAVKISYRQHKLPFIEVALSEISAFTLGQYLQFRMLEMMYLAELFDVNAFDQPNVEDYKSEMRALLTK